MTKHNPDHAASSIRTLCLKDAPSLAALHAACLPPGWSEASFAAFLQEMRVFGYVFEKDKGVCGFILCRAAVEECEILTFAVEADHRRQGIGQALLRCALQGAKKRAAKVMFLEVAADNEAALALYARYGFAEINRRKAYYANGADAVMMRLAVGS